MPKHSNRLWLLAANSSKPPIRARTLPPIPGQMENAAAVDAEADGTAGRAARDEKPWRPPLNELSKRRRRCHAVDCRLPCSMNQLSQHHPE
jgi:hypothetical protein